MKNYSLDVRDSAYAGQLWTAAVNGQLTDIKFQVGDKIFPAHRYLIAARCPALIPALVPGRPSNVTTVPIGSMDPALFEEILFFLYTGVLRTSPAGISEGFLAAAEVYKIETLRSLCQAAASKQMDADLVAKIVLSHSIWG